MESTSYFTAQALYQFGARALGMGSSSQRREITSGSSEASDPPYIARVQATDPSAMDIEPVENPTATLTSVTFSSTSVSMQASTLASMPHLSFPSIPGEFPFPSPRSPIPNTPSPSIYPFHIPSSHSPSSHDTSPPPAPASESSAKVRLRETPSLHVQRLKQRLRATEAKLSAASQKHQRSRKRFAIETAREASTKYARDLAAWEQRAASYEQQLRAQEARLLKVTAENAAVTEELRGALHGREEQLASLQSSLHGKDDVINQIQAHCQELSAKLEAVQLELGKDSAETLQLELRRERETAAAEREREILALEERMTRTMRAFTANTRPRPHGASSPDPHFSEVPHASTTARSRSPSTTPSRPSVVPRSSVPSRPSSTALPRTPSVPRSPTPSAAASRIARTAPYTPSTAATRRYPLSPIPADDSSESSPAPERLSRTPSPDNSTFEDVSERRPPTLPPHRMPRLAVPRHAQVKAVAKAVTAEKVAIGPRSEDRKEHLRQVRAVFAEFLGAPEDEDFVSSHSPAPREAVEAYLNGAGFGPDRNDLCFSDLKPYNNAWNRAVASELGAILFERQRKRKWRHPDGTRVAAASQPYWEDAVLEKFKRQAANWRDAMGQIVADGSTGVLRQESQTETNTRRCQRGEEQSKVARQRERRAKRWDRRRAICLAAINFATTTFDQNQWKQFLRIVETLGKEGMSSDESDTEEVTHRFCYRVSVLPWRRDFDAIMDKIDAARSSPQSGFSARGSRPTPRHRQEDADIIHVSRREAVPGLPLSFYDEQWLEERSDDYVERVLYVSEEPSDWVVQIANLYSTSST